MLMTKIKQWLTKLSFRTGLIILVICAFFYIISFAQFFLPIDASVKWILWVIFFGLAKTTQYTALLILGVEGVKRVKRYFKNKKNKNHNN